MKAHILTSAFAALLLSCTSPLDRKFNENTSHKDLKAIEKHLDSADFRLLGGSLVRLKIEEKELETMTYAEILELGKRWKIEQQIRRNKEMIDYIDHRDSTD